MGTLPAEPFPSPSSKTESFLCSVSTALFYAVCEVCPEFTELSVLSSILLGSLLKSNFNYIPRNLSVSFSLVSVAYFFGGFMFLFFSYASRVSVLISAQLTVPFLQAMMLLWCTVACRCRGRTYSMSVSPLGVSCTSRT